MAVAIPESRECIAVPRWLFLRRAFEELLNSPLGNADTGGVRSDAFALGYGVRLDVLIALGRRSGRGGKAAKSIK